MQEGVLSLAAAIELRRAEPDEAPNRPSHYTPDGRALAAITRRISTRFRNPKTFRSLTSSEQLVYNVGYVLDAEVQNGGLHQFLFNSSGDYAEEVRAGLRRIEAQGTLEAIDRVCALFPDGIVPTSRDVRNQHLFRAEDENEAAMWLLFDDATRAYREACPDLYRRLMEFVEGNLSDFALPDDAEVARSRS